MEVSDLTEDQQARIQPTKKFDLELEIWLWIYLADKLLTWMSSGSLNSFNTDLHISLETSEEYCMLPLEIVDVIQIVM